MVLAKHFLVHAVVVLIAKYNKTDGRVLEDLVAHHVLAQLVLKLLTVVLALHLNPVRLFHLDIETVTRL